MSEEYTQVLGKNQLPLKQLPSHALEVPSETSIDMITGGAVSQQVYSNPIVGPRIDSDVYANYINHPASNGNLLKRLAPIQGGAYANASNGFPYGHFYELQGGNMFRHGQPLSSNFMKRTVKIPPPYNEGSGRNAALSSYANENLVGYGQRSEAPDEFCPDDSKGGAVEIPKYDPKYKGVFSKHLLARKDKHWWAGPLGHALDWVGLGKEEKHAAKKIVKMMGGALSPEEHEKMGRSHPAFGSKYKKYVLQLSDKTGGSIFGKIWEGLKSAHNWVKDKKILSKAARAIQKGADFVSEHGHKALPFAAYGGPKTAAAAAAIHKAAPTVRDYSKKAGDFFEEHGYGGMKGRGLNVEEDEIIPEDTEGSGIQPERVYNDMSELVYQISGVPPNASSGRIITGVTPYALA